MIREWKSFLEENARVWGFPRDKWEFLLHNNYHPHCSNINLLWFQADADYPLVVTKLYRQPEILRREFDNLTRVHASAPAWVPRPLHFGFQGSFWALWMEGRRGSRYTGTTVHSMDTLRALADMVASLHGAVRQNAEAAEDRYERLVAMPLETVAGFGGSSAVRQGCALLAERVTREWMRLLPVIPQHGDLFSDNLLVDQGRLSVIDWETFGAIDLPFYDLLTLLLSLLRAQSDAPEQWPAALVRQAPELVDRYSRALQLPTGWVTLALPLTLVNWFHLQWSDGRGEFTKVMYSTLEHYFKQPQAWERVFQP
jgi:aminoglycoside phosphotransferase (APT) family kinase protein